jgi:hypothetical protein
MHLAVEIPFSFSIVQSVTLQPCRLNRFLSVFAVQWQRKQLREKQVMGFSSYYKHQRINIIIDFYLELRAIECANLFFYS